MKKILLITFIIWIMLPNYSFAAWACLIKDKSAQVLLDYVKENRIVIKNLTKEISKKKTEKIEENNNILWFQNNIEKTWEKIKNSSNEIVTMFNDFFTFNSYYSYFTFYAIFPITNEVPYQVMRDYKILENEYNWLTLYTKKINKKWYENIIIEKPCEWVNNIKELCESKLNNKTSWEILLELIKNNDQILDLYRNTVTSWDKIFENNKFILVWPNFVQEISTNYSTESINNCNSDEWWFFEQISNSIWKITTLNKQGKDWIKKWQETWQLLIWNKPEQYSVIEKDLLLSYLSEQWVSHQNKEIMLNNLEKYNLEWLNINNNFILNTYNSTKKKITEELVILKEDIFWDFINKNNENDTENTNRDTSINDIQNISDTSIITKNIKVRITKLYENELPFAAIWDNSVENLRSKIIKTHFELEESNKLLEKTIIKSKKICNSVDRWNWNCE